jgi:ribosomal protein S18 acetylase RimI-like enzyme
MTTLVWLGWFFCLVCNYSTLHTITVGAFSLSSNDVKPVVQVTQVQTLEEWQAVADLRFNEWIDNGGTTSREDFRRATVELYQHERPNAVLFLAQTTVLDDTILWGNPLVTRVGGAAELSPYELVNAVGVVPTTISTTSTTIAAAAPSKQQATITSLPKKIFYVTDVVTDLTFRRKGIAKALMQTLECHARDELEAHYLVLHVAPGNRAAIAFYQSVGYQDPLPRDLLNVLRVDVLSDNASTHGELLMSKTLRDSL